jgi:dihydropteroate synthase
MSQAVKVKSWMCGGRTLSLGSPLVMGILNVTPDSFFEGSRVAEVDAAVARGVAFYQAGAALLDVGAESTRPGATPLSVDEECDRLIPVISALRAALPNALLSADTRHTVTARAALEAGVDIINDVSGCAPDEGMLQLVATSGVGYVLTHAMGSASAGTLLDDPQRCTDTVIAELLAAAHHAESIGVKPEQIQLDPGLGFAKTTAVSTQLLKDTARFCALPYSVMIGASRKRFLGELTGQTDATARGAASIGAALLAAAAGADVIRVHDVRETVDALTVFSLLNQTTQTEGN